MKIPFLDLNHQTGEVLEDFLSQVRDLARKSQFVGGPPVECFESEFASYCGVPHCVALNSGTDGLRFALMACGLEADHEVITSPFTFIGTAEAVSETGRLVFADIDPETFTLSPRETACRVGSRTRALLPVHIFGLPAALPELSGLCRRHDLILIEDACQAHGASLNGRKAGSFGRASVFSFYPSKNLGAFGDAGAVTTGSAELAERIRLLRNHGQVGPFQHQSEGFNSRMDSFQAVALTLKLARLEGWVERRRLLAACYREWLQDIDEVRLQVEPDGYRHCYHLMAGLARRRDQLREFLAGEGIETRVIYPHPLHLLPAYARLGHGRGDFPNAERVCAEVLCFPIYPGMSEKQVEEVAAAVRRFYAG